MNVPESLLVCVCITVIHTCNPYRWVTRTVILKIVCVFHEEKDYDLEVVGRQFMVFIVL